MDHKNIAIAMASSLQARSYVLVMEHDQKYDGGYGGTKGVYNNNPDISFHPRERQPCWGELRKYEKTAKGECTQPSNSKPGDLWHPFPAGKPIAFAVDLTTFRGNVWDENTDAIMKFLLDETRSPFRRGLRQVSFIKNSAGRICGFYMNNLAIDATVLVFMLRQVASLLANAKYFVEYVNAGLEEGYALALIFANRYLPFRTHGIYGTTHFPPSISRLIKGNPRDLTGGTMDNRVDYNRTLIDELWKSNTPVSIYDNALKMGLPSSMKTGQTGDYEIKGYVPLIKELLDLMMKLEGPQENEKYIWKTTSGNTNAPEVKINDLGEVISTGKKVA
jgi:hypothetical protein